MNNRERELLKKMVNDRETCPNGDIVFTLRVEKINPSDLDLLSEIGEENE